MAVTRIYHGGPLKTEHFGGHSFWTWKLTQALDYAENPDCSAEGDLWTTEIDLTTEVVADLDDYAPVDPETGHQDWDEQTAGILAAVADGATVVLCEDGWVVVNVERLRPVRTTVADEDSRAESEME